MIREHFRMIRAGQTARDFLSGANFWAEMDDFRGKIEEISCMEGGETWGDARSTRNQANPWIKTNKSQKKLGLFLVGIFEFGEEHNKIKLENKGVGAPNS